MNRNALANSTDPDQMPRNAASDQGLHCLLSGSYEKNYSVMKCNS